MDFRILIILTLAVVGCYGDDDINSTDAQNPPTDLICKTCKCENNIVNCNDSKIDKFFSEADWAGVLSISPREIFMTFNTFTEVTPFSPLPIITLNMSHGNINSIKRASFKYLQNMTILDLSYNNLSSQALSPHVFEGMYTPEEYQPLISMRILNLAYNNLHSLNQDIFEHIPEVYDLTLKGNPFTIIDHQTVVAISSLALLKNLDLSDCKLKELPQYFLHSPKFLERFDISKNALQNVPEALEEGKSLKYLSISHNPIRYVEKNKTVNTAFHLMPSLEELHMCFMPKLEEIRAQGLSGLTNLKKLYLNNNPALSRIDADALASESPDGEGKYWPILEEIYLNKNNLSMIENGLIGRWDLLKKIDIRHNPYLCDCTSQWMVSTLAPIVINISSNKTSDIICHEPIEMRGKSMIHLEEIHNHMRCSDAYGDRPERDGMLLVGTLIGVLITVPVLLGVMLMYKRGYFSCFGVRDPAAFSRQFYKRADTNEFL